VPAWLRKADVPFFPHAALKAVPRSRRNKSLKTPVLPASNRLRSSKDFARTTKAGHRVTTPSLVLYLLTHNDFAEAPQFGLIVNKSIGGSVIRHRVARHIRHALRERISSFPNNTQIVVRVLKESKSYFVDLDEALTRAAKKVGA
jgi:ribonuclease P protein component